MQDDTVLVHFFLQGLTPEYLYTACLTRGPTMFQEVIEVATQLEPALGGGGSSDRAEHSLCLHCNACGAWKDSNSRCDNNSP